MGACTSNQQSPELPVAEKVRGSGIARRTSGIVCSELDPGSIPHAEKRTSKYGIDPTAARIGFACRKGRKLHESRQPNQDSWCVHRDNRLTLYGVFDGHGPKGHLVSDHVKRVLPQAVAQAVRNAPEGNVETQVKATFENAQRGVVAKRFMDPEGSGTTATVVLHNEDDGSLLISHVGDSAAVLVRQRIGSGTHSLEGIRLTRDHKPELPDERRRIQVRGGRVAFDGYCHRVVRKCGQGPGLNMSRSIGDDLAHRVCGVSSEAEISRHCLAHEDRVLLVCSDGIWEVLSPQEAADLIGEFGRWQANEAAKCLADEAAARWNRGTNGQMADDITCLVVYVDDFVSPRNTNDGTETTEIPSSCSGSLTSSASENGLMENANPLMT